MLDFLGTLQPSMANSAKELHVDLSNIHVQGLQNTLWRRTSRAHLTTIVTRHDVVTMVITGMSQPPRVYICARLVSYIIGSRVSFVENPLSTPSFLADFASELVFVRLIRSTKHEIFTIFIFTLILFIIMYTYRWREVIEFTASSRLRLKASEALTCCQLIVCCMHVAPSANPANIHNSETSPIGDRRSSAALRAGKKKPATGRMSHMHQNKKSVS